MTLAVTIEELEALASGMEAQTKVAHAKHAELCLQKEPGQAAIYERKVSRGQHYIEVIRNAIRLLKARQKSGAFIPPSFPELAEYCATAFPTWPKSDYLSWWNHFESCGWKIGKGKSMVNWKRAAANGFKNWGEKNSSGKATATKEEDPVGWREFLVKAGRPYSPYRFEAEFVRADYMKSKGK